MSKVLGLDLGTASIGWALINSREEQIIDAGVRIFPEGVENLGEGDNEQSKNATRRDKRQVRRQNFRRKMRKWRLAKVLIKHEMFPAINPIYRELTGNDPSGVKFRKKFKRVVQQVRLPEELRNYFSIDPYEARHKAYEGEELSLYEMGRILYHFAQRRGYRETLQDDGDDKSTIYKGDPKEEKTGINETREKIEKYGTLGNYLYHEDPHKTRLRNRYTLRSMYEDEFNIIWDNQKKFYPDVLTEELRLKIGGSKRKGDKKDGILFYQRPLRSQKHLIANCTFETDKPRSKKSIIPFELFRSYQLANSIRVDGYPLSDEDRETALEFLNSRKRNQKFSKLRKKFSDPDGNYNYSDDDRLPANNTIYHFRKIFGKNRWNNFSLEAQEEIWHIKYMADDPDWLKKYAKEKWGLEKDEIEILKNFKLDEDYANLSRKAMMNILPYLERGFLYDKAVLLGGLRGAFGSKIWDQMSPALKEEIEEKVLNISYDYNKSERTIDEVKKLLVEHYDLPKSKTNNLYHHSVEEEVKLKSKLPAPENIRNPIVQQALFEVRKVVNALIGKYGKPDEIRVELARELKSSKKHRERIRRRQQEREDENIKIKATLDEYGLPHTRHNIHKVKLFNEIFEKAGKAINPYNPEQTFGIEDLLRQDGYVQIEHIIPESISLDDSLANKTLCGADTNREKGNMTPYQYFMSKGMSKEEWENYKSQIFDILPFYKAKKFISEKDPELDDFIQRQLNDTRYISKLAKNYLKYICPKITVAQGSVTSMLRYYWGLNGILGGKYDVGDIQNGEYLAAVDSEDKIIELVEWDEETIKQEQKRLEKKGQFLQGNVSDGIFYPFKKRDDHRHHAVDSITVACSERKYLQQISRLSGKGWENNSIKNHFEVQPPWKGFWEDAKDAIDNILVSHKQNDRILTKVKKQLYDYKGNPKTDDDGNKLFAEGKAARGRLHRETIYGKHIGEGGEVYYHHRKPVDFIKNYKHLAKVVSPRVRKAVERRLGELGLDTNKNKEWRLTDLPKEKRNQVFFKFEELKGKKKRIAQIKLPNKNGDSIPVKKVRVIEAIGNAVQLKDGLNQFVDPYGNHHVILFKNKDGEIDEQVLTFWEVVERKKQGQSAFQLPPGGKNIITTLQINDLFLLELDNEIVRDKLDDYKFISNYLYRVQKLSSKFYEFRLVSEATLDNDFPPYYQRIQSFGNGKTGWNTHNPIKVEVSPIGELKIME